MRSKLWGRSRWESRRIAGGGGEREAGEERAGGGTRVESRTNRGNYATMLHISQSILDQTEKAG